MISRDQSLLGKSAVSSDSISDGNSSALSAAPADAAFDSRILELVHYARDKDPAERTTLFRNLIDMFLTGKAPSGEPTRSQLLKVIKALIPHVDADARQTACDLVASLTSPPMDLIFCLVQDRALLVAKLLRSAPFSEEEMIDLIQVTGRAHHQELASRNDLSANVWIALARAAPIIEPSISDRELWNDQLFNGRPSATVTQLRPNGLNTLETATSAAQNSRPIADDVFLNGAQDAPADADPLKMTGHILDERFSPEENQVQPADMSQQNQEPDVFWRANDAQKAAIQRSWEKPETVPTEEPAEPQPALPHDDSDIHVFLTQPSEGQSEVEPQQIFATEENDRVTPVASWIWRTDRSLVVQSIDQLCDEIGKELEYREGATVFDLLGLNEKPNHPVVKALNRRGTIHDVPIYLKTLPKGHRYWTLEATPLFDLSNGHFQGYQGKLTGVMPSGDDVNFELPEELPTPRIEFPEMDQADQQASQPASMPSAGLQELIEKGAAVEIQHMQQFIEARINEELQKHQPKKIDESKAETPTPTAEEATQPAPKAKARHGTALQTLEQLEKSMTLLLSMAEDEEGPDPLLKQLHQDIAANCLKTLKAQLAT